MEYITNIFTRWLQPNPLHRSSMHVPIEACSLDVSVASCPSSGQQCSHDGKASERDPSVSSTGRTIVREDVPYSESPQTLPPAEPYVFERNSITIRSIDRYVGLGRYSLISSFSCLASPALESRLLSPIFQDMTLPLATAPHHVSKRVIPKPTTTIVQLTVLDYRHPDMQALLFHPQRQSNYLDRYPGF